MRNNKINEILDDNWIQQFFNRRWV
jgi:hypothetical protein